MPTKAAVTTIYLTTEQKRTLMHRAKQMHSTFSRQIREAIDRSLRQPADTPVDEQAIVRLAGKADEAIVRIGHKLDKAHAAVTETIHALSAKSR